MTTRIFNILMGLWLFASAFILPQGRGQVATTAICGALTVLFAALTSYDRRSRYLSEAVGALVACWRSLTIRWEARASGTTASWVSRSRLARGRTGTAGRSLRARPLRPSRQRLGRPSDYAAAGNPGPGAIETEPDGASLDRRRRARARAVAVRDLPRPQGADPRQHRLRRQGAAQHAARPVSPDRARLRHGAARLGDRQRGALLAERGHVARVRPAARQARRQGGAGGVPAREGGGRRRRHHRAEPGDVARSWPRGSPRTSTCSSTRRAG